MGAVEGVGPEMAGPASRRSFLPDFKAYQARVRDYTGPGLCPHLFPAFVLRLRATSRIPKGVGADG